MNRDRAARVRWARRSLVAGATLLTVGVAAWWAVTGQGFSARERPSALEALVARRLRGLAIPRGAMDATNPVLATELVVAEGRDHFADHCAICHANDGSGETMINEGLYPPAPDLRVSETQDLTDGELFYIIRNGVRFTGMPGWGGDDAENWKLVHFVRHLPSITEEELGLMRELKEHAH